MEQQIELKHPKEKKSISMDKSKYDLLKKAFLNYLKKNGQSSYNDIWQAVDEELKKGKAKFAGSVQWHVEWIKLDLEANKIIARVPNTIPKQYVIVEK